MAELSAALSVALLLAYELRVLWVARRQPGRIARSAHARLRGQWVAALHGRPGFEIVAVQALRNSLMSATISASTTALGLLASISVAANAGLSSGPWLHAAIALLLMSILFASHVCSAMAMRYFHHTGFILSMPAGSPEREPLEGLAACYVQRGGVFYGWGLRCFLMVPPLLAGLGQPLWMLPATVVTVYVLWLFDRPGCVG